MSQEEQQPLVDEVKIGGGDFGAAQLDDPTDEQVDVGVLLRSNKPKSVVSMQATNEKFANKLSTFESFCYTFKGFVGIAILSVPLALQTTGIVAGTIILVVVSIFNAYANHLVISSRALVTTDAKTYCDLGHAFLSKPVAISIDIIFVIHKLLIGTAFLEYFGEQIELIICETQGRCGY